MKKAVLSLALLALAAPALAQVGVDAQSTAGARAELGAVTSNTTLNMPGAPETQVIRQKGLPVASSGNAWATPGWRCSDAGDAGSFQSKNLGFALSLGGDDKNICGHEFRIAVAVRVVELRLKGDESYDSAHAIACNDDVIADSWEGTIDACNEPKPNARKERWARERAAASQRGATASASAIPVAARPMPWQAGG